MKETFISIHYPFSWVTSTENISNQIVRAKKGKKWYWNIESPCASFMTSCFTVNCWQKSLKTTFEKRLEDIVRKHMTKPCDFCGNTLLSKRLSHASYSRISSMSFELITVITLVYWSLVFVYPCLTPHLHWESIQLYIYIYFKSFACIASHVVHPRARCSSSWVLIYPANLL